MKHEEFTKPWQLSQLQPGTSSSTSPLSILPSLHHNRVLQKRSAATLCAAADLPSTATINSSNATQWSSPQPCNKQQQLKSIEAKALPTAISSWHGDFARDCSGFQLRKPALWKEQEKKKKNFEVVSWQAMIFNSGASCIVEWRAGEG